MPLRHHSELRQAELNRQANLRRDRRQRLYTKWYYYRILKKRIHPREVAKRQLEEILEPYHALRKAINEGEWTRFWEIFFPRGYGWLRRQYELYLNVLEFFRTLRDLMLRQAAVVFKVEHRTIYPDKARLYVLDKSLLELSEDDRLIVISTLLQVASGRKITWEEIQEIPALRAFVERFIAYYQKFPCKHSAFVLRLTPVIYNYAHLLRSTYYVLRWVPAENLKADPYLGRSRPVSFGITPITYKPDSEVWNAMMYAGEGIVDLNDLLTLRRDATGEKIMVHPLRRIIYSPHHVTYEFARELGKPELTTVIHHCSPYIRIGRKSRTGKILDYQHDPRITRHFRRKFVKELTYYMGLRA